MFGKASQDALKVFLLPLLVLNGFPGLGGASNALQQQEESFMLMVEHIFGKIRTNAILTVWFLSQLLN